MAAANTKIRVLVVDDSAFMRNVLNGIISGDPQMEVVGQAKDGRDAVSMADSLQPDVITMDINMPRMDGLEATELIMTHHPRPIVVVSSVSREGAASTLRALELGAIDFVPKPTSGVDLDMQAISSELNRKLKMAAKVRVVRTATRSKALRANAYVPASLTPLAAEGAVASSATRFPIIVVAASTGGPATVMRLIPSFPRDFPAAILLVQHMPPSFTSQYSLQLAEVASLEVKDAVSNDALRPGTLYVCPGSHHLRVSALGRIALDGGPRISGYRPCADLAMESAAAYGGPLSIGVILTGMGNDGSRGARAIKAAGGTVFAQDEATAVIFGMPAEAIKAGAVNQILSLDQIYPAIEKRVQQLWHMPQVCLR